MTGPKTIGYETHRSLWTAETKRYTVPNQSSITDTYKYKVIVQIGDVQFNNRPPAYAFSYIYAEGKTRGVGENWAIIYCPN